MAIQQEQVITTTNSEEQARKVNSNTMTRITVQGNNQTVVKGTFSTFLNRMEENGASSEFTNEEENKSRRKFVHISQHSQDICVFTKASANTIFLKLSLPDLKIPEFNRNHGITNMSMHPFLHPKMLVKFAPYWVCQRNIRDNSLIGNVCVQCIFLSDILRKYSRM